jgi:hypothetical protein
MWLGDRLSGRFVGTSLLFAAMEREAALAVRLPSGVTARSSNIGICIGVATPMFRALPEPTTSFVNVAHVINIVALHAGGLRFVFHSD